MSKLQFDFEIIQKINESKEIKKEEILQLGKNAPKELIFDTASRLRDEKKGKNVSFSKKAFFNIINLCRDTCSYCTYKSEINESKLTMMEPNDVIRLAKLSKKVYSVDIISEFVKSAQKNLKKLERGKSPTLSVGVDQTAAAIGNI